jgi:catechol 2,3-dioxygenase-like lactoylglutathione lyase family enzyme
MSSLIKRMAHVGLRVPDLDASVAWATKVMGMREVERAGGTSYLTHADCHHSLQLIADDRAAFDHLAMQAHDDEALDRLTARLRERGVPILSEDVQERGIGRAVRFQGPAGHVLEVFTGNVDHHGIGLVKGPAGMNHYAWQVENLAILGLLGDVLARNASRFIWGPGRHGAGENIFTYHFDPAGMVVEYYADLYQVWDERTYVPGEWSLDDYRGQNLWGAGTPPELMEAATPLA